MLMLLVDLSISLNIVSCYEEEIISELLMLVFELSSLFLFAGVLGTFADELLCDDDLVAIGERLELGLDEGRDGDGLGDGFSECEH